MNKTVEISWDFLIPVYHTVCVPRPLLLAVGVNTERPPEDVPCSA